MYFVISEVEFRTRGLGPGEPVDVAKRVERLLVGGGLQSEAAAIDLANSCAKQGTTLYVVKAVARVACTPRTEKL